LRIVATLLAIILTMSASVMADAIRITSSDHALAFAYSEMIWQPSLPRLHGR
jgi:hypothetical protein